MTLFDPPSTEALTRSLMLGTLRQPPPIERATDGLLTAPDEASVLKTLALLAQARRFDRPAASVAEAAPSFLADPRPTVPEAARRLLLALFGRQGKADDATAVVIAETIARRGLKLHPFDLPRLDAFAKAQADRLGGAAAEWVERRAAPGKRPASPHLEAIDEENWRLGRPAQRADFIRDLRRSAPDRARRLVEAAFGSEPAPVRVALLQALRPELSVSDQPFLESLARDRAPSVREAAEALLARLPGSPYASKALEAFAGRIVVARTGLLRRRTTLRLDYPANVKGALHQVSWAFGQAQGLGLAALAARVGLDADAWPEAVADDPVLAEVAALLAARDGRFDLLARLIRAAGGEIERLLLYAAEMDGWPPERWAAWCRAAIQPALWAEMPSSTTFALLPRSMRRPLPSDVAQALLASPAWRTLVDRALGKVTGAFAAEMFDDIALLTPAPLRDALRRELEPLPPNHQRRAQRIMTLLDMLEAAAPEIAR